MPDLTCGNRSRFGILDTEKGFIEFKCDRPRCGASPAIVVLHRFSLTDGQLMETLRFQKPKKE